MEEWTWAFIELFFQLFTPRWCSHRYDRMGSSFQMALRQGCRERRGNTIPGLIQQPLSRDRYNQRRASKHTQLPRLKASPFLPGSSSLVGQTSSEFSRAKEEYREAFHQSARRQGLTFTPWTVATPTYPHPPFSIVSKRKTRISYARAKELSKVSSFLPTSVRSAISKFLPDCLEAGHLRNLKIGLGEQIGARLKSKSFPKSATTSTHPG